MVTSSFELEGHVGYNSHFELEGTATENRGLLYDLVASLNFPRVSRDVAPFVYGGVGGITTLNDNPPFTFQFRDQMVRWEDGDTFLTLSYGFGVKASRLWGPVGLRADIGARTLPNFFGKRMTAFDFAAGVNFVFGGER